jgi:hypothetical protein
MALGADDIDGELLGADVGMVEGVLVAKSEGPGWALEE